MIFPHDPDGANGSVPLPDPPEVPETQMQDLYKLSDWVLKTGPWKVMYDFQAIVIVDPDTGDRQIAVVMGNAKTVYGIHLYQPEEGLRWYSNIHRYGSSSLSAHNAQFDNRYLEIEFTDGSELSDHDEALDDHFAPDDWFDENDMDKLNAVTFRSVIPGCPPWYPNEAEASRMADALRLVRRFYEEFLQDYDWASFTLDPDEDQLDLPTFTLPKGARREDSKAWSFAMAPFTAPDPKEVPEILPDDLFVTRLDSLKVRPRTTWELGAIFSPNPMVDGDRPVYPTIAVIGVRESGCAEGSEVLSSLKPREQLLRSSVLKATQDLGYLPSEIIVGSPIAELALTDLCQKKNITLTPSESMPLFSDIAKSLAQSPFFQNDDLEDSPLSQITSEEAQKIDDLMREMPANASPGKRKPSSTNSPLSREQTSSSNHLLNNSRKRKRSSEGHLQKTLRKTCPLTPT